MPPVMTANAANALPMHIVKIAMPRQYAATATNGNCVGSARATRSATTGPTPAFAKIPPSAASICGKISAQPIACSSRPPSFTGTATFAPVECIATPMAISAPSPSEISVTCFGSISEKLPN